MWILTCVLVHPLREAVVRGSRSRLERGVTRCRDRMCLPGGEIPSNRVPTGIAAEHATAPHDPDGDLIPVVLRLDPAHRKPEGLPVFGKNVRYPVFRPKDLDAAGERKSGVGGGDSRHRLGLAWGDRRTGERQDRQAE